jgi:hypothetical protein
VPELRLEPDRVESRLDESRREQRPHLGREEQQIARLPTQPRDVQRLDAEPIARDQQASRARVVEREAEHAAQPRHEFRSPAHVGVDQDFGVGLGAEHRARCFEFAAQLAIVVDLPL